MTKAERETLRMVAGNIELALDALKGREGGWTYEEFESMWGITPEKVMEHQARILRWMASKEQEGS